jgi:sugar phosphate isomerase/epimerase
MTRKMGRPVISAFADEYSPAFAEQCEGLSRLGIGYIEIRNADGKSIASMTEEETDRLGGILACRGIKVSSIGSPLGKIRITAGAGDIEEHMKKAERVFSAASKLGASRVRIFSFYIPAGEDKGAYADRVALLLNRFCDMADRRGLTLCHENEAGIYGESPEECEELLDRLEGRVSAVFDMGNFVLCGYEPMQAYELLRPRIDYFHIKDALFAGAVVPPGRGEARIKDILDDYAKRSGTDFFVTLEPHLQTFAGLNALSDRHFDNPYRFADCREAFEAAAACLREML